MKINLDTLLMSITALILPFIILMGAVRLMITPKFPALEYDRPGFPEDAFGFSTAERKQWSAYAVNYLTNDAGVEYLKALSFADGTQLFRNEELDHMEDVKQVVKTSLTVWYGLIGLGIAMAIWVLSFGHMKTLLTALRSGAWLTLGLVVSVLVLLAISFDKLFDQFHRLFFSEGSWLFYADDTLIRLFPIVFWRDGFLLVFLFTSLVAVMVLWLTKRRKRKEKANA